MKKHKRQLTPEHLEKVKRNLSTYMENETPEQKQARGQKIAEHRKRETALYRYMKNHKDILKRVIDEVKNQNNN